MTLLLPVAILAACSGESDRGSLESEIPVLTTGQGQMLLLDCLHERGWTEMTYDPVDESIGGVEIPADQMDVFRQDRADCRAENPYDLPELTAERAEKYYRELIETTQCVADLGFEVEDIPSVEVSIAGMMDDGDPGWDPFTYLEPEDFAEIQPQCPYPKVA